MDWGTVVAVWVASVASAVSLALFVVRKWLGVRIEESVRHEYDRKLEEHKAALQEQVTEALHRLER